MKRYVYIVEWHSICKDNNTTVNMKAFSDKSYAASYVRRQVLTLRDGLGANIIKDDYNLTTVLPSERDIIENEGIKLLIPKYINGIVWLRINRLSLE